MKAVLEEDVVRAAIGTGLFLDRQHDSMFTEVQPLPIKNENF